jgi:AcrR family transcriptional regulator
MSAQRTRARILDAAEDLFARHGVAGTSLRALTAQAGVNLAAVHYHFGSKDALLDAVVERRAQPMNAERMVALGKIEAAIARGELADERERVEAILGAFFLPGLHGIRDLPEGKSGLAQLLASIDALPPETIEDLLRQHFGDPCERFVAALEGALPELPSEQVADRFRFAMAILTRLLSGHFDLDTIPNRPPCRVDDESRLRHAIAFIVAGLVAPAVPAAPTVLATRTHGAPGTTEGDISAAHERSSARKAASS